MIDSLSQLVPILLITALVQFGKEVLNIPSKYARIASFAVAVVFGVLFIYNQPLTQIVVDILAYALSAIGLWEVAKPKYENLKKR